MDLVVTVPFQLWEAWLKEGDLATVPPARPKASRRQYAFCLGVKKPDVQPGDRVYIAAHGRLRGYAPLIRLEKRGRLYYAIRAGGAVAVTIGPPVGPRCFSLRRWKREDETPFPKWQAPSGAWDGIERVILQARAVLGIDQQTLARRLDWAHSRLSQIEARRIGVRDDEVPALMQALGLDKEALDAALHGVPVGDLLRRTEGRREDDGRGPDRHGVLVGSDGPGDPTSGVAADDGVAVASGSEGAGRNVGGVPSDGSAASYENALSLPGAPSRVVRGVTLTWKVQGARLVLKATVNGHAAGKISIARRHDANEQWALQDEAEAVALGAFGRSG